MNGLQRDSGAMRTQQRDFTSQREEKAEWSQPTLGWNQTYLFLFSGRLLKQSAFHRAAAASDAFFFCSRRFSSRRERRGFSSGQHGCCFSSAVVVVIIIIIAAAITAARRVLRGLSCFIRLLSPFFSSSRRQKSAFLMLCSKFEVKSELCS